MKLKVLLASVALATVTGCATYEPVPKDYKGPTVTVRDSGFAEDGTKAQMFALVEVDQNTVMNAFWESRNASQGHGSRLTTVFTQRELPVRPMKVKLRASHATGMPIHEMASRVAGTFFEVEGIVDFTPEAGHSYEVKGDLKKEKSSVWIQDWTTGKAATSVVSK